VEQEGGGVGTTARCGGGTTAYCRLVARDRRHSSSSRGCRRPISQLQLPAVPRLWHRSPALRLRHRSPNSSRPNCHCNCSSYLPGCSAIARRRWCGSTEAGFLASCGSARPVTRFASRRDGLAGTARRSPATRDVIVDTERRFAALQDEIAGTDWYCVHILGGSASMNRRGPSSCWHCGRCHSRPVQKPALWLRSLKPLSPKREPPPAKLPCWNPPPP
jgi:hypothetical protein